MVSNLAIQLREGTSKSHSMAENVSFVKSFLGGVIDKESYKNVAAIQFLGTYSEFLNKLESFWDTYRVDKNKKL